jgi:hypothetical protein
MKIGLYGVFTVNWYFAIAVGNGGGNPVGAQASSLGQPPRGLKFGTLNSGHNPPQAQPHSSDQPLGESLLKNVTWHSITSATLHFLAMGLPGAGNYSLF